MHKGVYFMKLYFVSYNRKLDVKYLRPRVPESAIADWEDIATPRLCMCPSIMGCLQAVEALNKQKYHVYEAEIPDEIIHYPKPEEVYDAFITGEVWVKQKVKVKYFGLLCIDEYLVEEYMRQTLLGARKPDALFRWYDWHWIQK